MPNWKNLGERAKVAADKAKDVVDKRGGTEGLKRDAGELKKIATGEGTVKEKAQKAASALKEPSGEEAKPEAEAGAKPAEEAKPEGEAKPEAEASDRDPGAPEAPAAPPPKQT